MNPDNTVFDAKRLIGRRFDDSSVQSDMKLWPFQVINDGSKPKIRVDYKSEQKTFFPEEISSMVLVKMKEIAEAYLGKVCVVYTDLYICILDAVLRFTSYQIMKPLISLLLKMVECLQIELTRLSQSQ